MDSTKADEELEARAACLINPASGIANDYLNVFNEVLLLIENLPILLPELMADLEQWEPISYRDYFAKSSLPGSDKALAVYDKLDPSFREKFEAKIAEVADIARGGKVAIRAIQEESGSLDGEGVPAKCGELAVRLRATLMEATDMVNNGAATRSNRAQVLADRLMELSA
jgi:hypothetical protein